MIWTKQKRSRNKRRWHMDDMTDPELQAEEERKMHRARRQQRKARRKIRAEMTAAAVAAAADHAREEMGTVDGAVHLDMAAAY